MNIANITIQRAIAHDVVRVSKFEEHQPLLSDDLLVLDEKGRSLLGRRLVDTVASGSHCVDVTVDESGTGSPFATVASMLDAGDHEYVAHSKDLAKALSTAQTAGAIKAGSALFVQGSCVADGKACRFVSIVKADPDQAFYKRVHGDRITLTYVNDMLLGESQRLVKVAFFVEEEPPTSGLIAPRLPDDFAVRVFDHHMQTSGDGNAAVYFYRTFLKCRIAHGAASQTKRFFETVKSFIEEMPGSQADRVAFQGDLISYLRRNSQVIEPREFALDVFPALHQDAFLAKCRDAGLTGAFSKQLDLVKAKLRRQSIRFTSSVTLYAPAEIFRESVKITGVTADGWTELRIRGSVDSMP